MDTGRAKRRKDFVSVFNAIKASDGSDLEKVTEAFEWMTRRYIEETQPEVELARAMKDEEALVKAHIRLSMMKSAREMYQDCYRFMLGRSAWDEPE
jgi:hypothetical protein